MNLSTGEISVFVQDLFPSLYKAEGNSFIAFVQSYYEWMEQDGNALNVNRKLLNLRDVDNTVDSFVEYFKDKYLLNVPLQSATAPRTMVKHATEIYKSKGTARSIELLFKLLYDQSVEVVRPGDNVLRASDGDWFVPRYLELSVAEKTRFFIGKTITGGSSGATAIVESVVRRSVEGKVFDLAFLTSIVGNFETGEIVTFDGDLEGCPRVTGSMTRIDILNAGRNFNVGDVVDVVSNILGRQGKARITNIANATGRVDFELINGGTGYTSTANVMVSERILVLNNVASSNSSITGFAFKEVVKQNIAQIDYISSNTTSIVLENVLQGKAANGVVVSTGVVLGVTPSNSTTGQVLLQVTSGSFVNATSINANNTAGAVISAFVDRSATGLVIGSNTTAIGVVAVSNVFSANAGATIVGLTSNVTADLQLISTGSGATFSVGSLTDTETVFLNSDLLSANNTANVPFLSIRLDGSNGNNGIVATVNVVSGGTGYSNGDTVVFSGGTPTTNAVATIITNGSGVILSAPISITGSGYDTAPTITITTGTGTGANLTAYMEYGYGFPKLPPGDLNNLINELLTRNTFILGTISSLTNINPGAGYNLDPFVAVVEDKIAPFNRRNLQLQVANVSGTFITGESLEQQIVREAYTLTLTSINGVFSPGETVRQVQSNTNVVLGEVVEQVGTLLSVYSDETFNLSNTVVGLSSSANAAVTTIVANNTTAAAKGEILSSNSSTITVERTRFATSFGDGLFVTGSQSGATALVFNVTEVADSPVMGNNAIVIADAGTANGIVTGVSVTNSGYAYIEGEEITLISPDNNFIATGIVHLERQGEGEGYWASTKGFLNNKYLHDNDYYQDYSYEVRAGVALNRYQSVLKQVLHVSGTKLFGKYVDESVLDMGMQVSYSSVVGAPPIIPSLAFNEQINSQYIPVLPL